MTGFQGWEAVADGLDAVAAQAEGLDVEHAQLDEGQCASIRMIAQRMRGGRRALLIADEVGMGKTRIAAALISAVRSYGGRAAIVMPAGLGAQWQKELAIFDPDHRTLMPLRSYESFIRGFAREGRDGLRQGWQERRNAKLNDRRQQRELPESSWQDEKILMISHAFARMTFPLPENGKLPWRRELMPAFEALCKGRRRNMRAGGRGERQASHEAARAAFATHAAEPLPMEWARDWRLMPSEDFRRALLPVIGRALGRFDLVVIDEAHKARGEDSSLSRILSALIWESADPFRLGMTATPVELEAQQWLNTLQRICGPAHPSADGEGNGGDLRAIIDPISKYAEIAKRLRTEPLDEALVSAFEKAAKCFSSALGPYVIRRDKRSDRELKGFQEAHGCSYRDIRTVSVTTKVMGRDWMRAFCAAEALSLLPETDTATKRRRLTVEKGHGLDKLILEPATAESKAALDFWSSNARPPQDASIFTHPAVLAAVRIIEAATAEGRKVLVFGTLLQPLFALTRLLDARAMLRHLAEGKHWPGREIDRSSAARDLGAVEAVRAALRSPDCPVGIPNTVEDINRVLAARYDSARQKRDANLRSVHGEISAEAERGNDIASLISQIWSKKEHEQDGIAPLLQALESRRRSLPSEAQDSGAQTNWTADCLIKETRQLALELQAGSSDAFAEETPVGSPARDESQRQLLEAHLSEFSGRGGSFARLLYGETQPQTRRFLQSAFNRAGAWPMVLVAQSMVGREGLNLHEECRTVVLLHAEWNPGVVEQQIGRVDRKNSRFLKDYRAGDWRKHGVPPPRIEVSCIQMDGGYDSLHWAQLLRRWDELRAQLHGDVVSMRDRQRARSDPELESLIRRLDLAAPDFYPR